MTFQCYIPPPDYPYDNNISVIIPSRVRFPSQGQSGNNGTVNTVSTGGYDSIRSHTPSRPDASQFAPSSKDGSSSYESVGGMSLGSANPIYTDVNKPNQCVRSNRMMIAVVSALALILLAAAGSTLGVMVFTEVNPTDEGDPPVDGIWNDWQTWGDCSASCGNGVMTRNRTCEKPPPSFGGNNCEGPPSENQSCKLTNCSVNGNWSVWLTWGSCSASCDNGTKTRNRTCDNPVPAYDGEDCNGIDMESEVCIKKHCPTNGNWSSWQPWNDCSITCGGGLKNRTRICDNPAPEHNGLDCDGHGFESSSCGEVTCPPPGVWGTWTEWTDCSVSCGEGVASRTRICDNSAGGECIGTSSETKVCQHRFKCYDSWGDWSACSVTCGRGIRTRNRTCDGKFTGQECGVNHPTFTDTQTCVNSKTCPEPFCANRNASCSYNHPNRCDLYITCDENKVMHERMCNVLLRYKVRVDDECEGDCDWEFNVPCSL
ncbi:coadhesin-like isoform X2 [Mizuhopecten yessoensis]|uniref:coadhesin-like isoform X2 n=1 Tax=Mizuhopecten yessoensis TaxID=6573 RepID=UPI000B45A9E8|nr:coadhesin-like isoform X2 [Mizuhopecten yessoensis]